MSSRSSTNFDAAFVPSPPPSALPHLGIYGRPTDSTIIQLSWTEFRPEAGQPPHLSLTPYGDPSLPELKEVGQFTSRPEAKLPELLSWLQNHGFRLTLPISDPTYQARLGALLAEARRRVQILYFADRHEVSHAEAAKVVERVASTRGPRLWPPASS